MFWTFTQPPTSIVGPPETLTNFELYV